MCGFLVAQRPCLSSLPFLPPTEYQLGMTLEISTGPGAGNWAGRGAGLRGRCDGRGQRQRSSSREGREAQGGAFFFKAKSNTCVNLTLTCLLRTLKPGMNIFLSPSRVWWVWNALNGQGLSMCLATVSKARAQKKRARDPCMLLRDAKF